MPFFSSPLIGESSARPGAQPLRPSACALVTGFDAFNGASINPSWLAVEALHGELIGNHSVVAAQLPTVFGASLQELKRLMQLHQPELVICVGLAGGRSALSLERIAINLSDAAIPDNAGVQPMDVPVIAGGPSAYFSSLPIKAMLQTLHGAGIPAEVSMSAGTFVCNHVFYGLMHELAKQHLPQRPEGGFIHVPYLPGQGQPSMQLEDMVCGLRLAVACALSSSAFITRRTEVPGSASRMDGCRITGAKPSP